MRLLAKHFPVLLVPEAYTSKSCFFCNELRSAVAHDRMKRRFKDKNGNNVEREVRGLRVCNNQGCSARCLNRDLNAALNIGKRAWHLVRGEVPPNMDAVAAKVRDDPHASLCCVHGRREWGLRVGPCDSAWNWPSCLVASQMTAAGELIPELYFAATTRAVK